MREGLTFSLNRRQCRQLKVGSSKILCSVGPRAAPRDKEPFVSSAVRPTNKIGPRAQRGETLGLLFYFYFFMAATTANGSGLARRAVAV